LRQNFSSHFFGGTFLLICVICVICGSIFFGCGFGSRCVTSWLKKKRGTHVF
jgi:hypothetical protein